MLEYLYLHIIYLEVHSKQNDCLQGDSGIGMWGRFLFCALLFPLGATLYCYRLNLVPSKNVVMS